MTPTKSKEEIKVGDKLIHFMIGEPFVFNIIKITKTNYHTGDFFFKKKECYKWTKEKQSILDNIDILKDEISKLKETLK